MDLDEAREIAEAVSSPYKWHWTGKARAAFTSDDGVRYHVSIDPVNSVLAGSGGSAGSAFRVFATTFDILGTYMRSPTAGKQVQFGTKRPGLIRLYDRMAKRIKPADWMFRRTTSGPYVFWTFRQRGVA